MGKKKENPKSSDKIRIEIESELAVCEDPAYVKVFLGEELVAHVVGAVKFEEGADNTYYPVVKLAFKKKPD